MKKLILGFLLAVASCSAPAFAYVPPPTATAPITISNTNVIACPTCLTGSGGALSLGSINNTNPTISGTTNNGFYTAGAGLVDVGIAGSNVTEWSSTGQQITGVLGVSGHVTFEGVTSTGATGTGQLVFGTSPTFATQITTPAIVDSATTGTGMTITSLSTGTGISVTPTTTGTGYLFNSTGAGLTTGKAISVAGTATMTADYSGAFISVAPVRTMTAAATRAESGNMLAVTPSYTITGTLASIMNVSSPMANFSRTVSNTSSSASSSINLSGAVAAFTNPAPTRTNPVVDTASVVTITQSDASASGTVLAVTNSGTGQAASFGGTVSTTGNVGIAQAPGTDALDVTGAIKTTTNITVLGSTFLGSTAQMSVDASGNINTTGNISDISTTGNAVITGQGHQQSGGGAFLKLRDDTLGNFGYVGDNSVIFGGTSYNELTITNPQSAGTICIVSNGGGSSTANTGCDILDDASNRIVLGGALVMGGTTFTIASGCGTPTSLTGGKTAGSFLAGQVACAPVINLPTAPHGWICQASDITTVADTMKQTATSTTTCTLSGTVVASDQILFTAIAY